MAALGSPVRRAVAPRYSSRTTGPLRRRLIVGLLILLSLAMITVYFREAPSGGGLHGFQSAGASAMRPFEIAANRVARPFKDAYHWTADLFHARSENADLRGKVDRLSQQAIQNALAAQENADLRRALHYVGALTYKDFAKTAVTAGVITNPASEFDQSIVIDAGSSKGIRVHDAVVTNRGLVGQVAKVFRNESRVTLLTDKEIAVTAKDHQTGAMGIVRHSQGPEDLLFLDRVPKSKVVNKDDLVITAGRQQGPLSSFYPAGIPIGFVTKVGQTDVNQVQDVQIVPRVDFTSLNIVLVLVSKQPRPKMP